MDGSGSDQEQAPQQPKKNWWEGASLNVPDDQKEVTRVVESWKDLRSPDYWRTAHQAREQRGTSAQCSLAIDDANGQQRSFTGLTGSFKEELEQLRSQFREEMNSMRVEFEEKISRIKTEKDEMAAKINEMATSALKSASKMKNVEGLLAQAGRRGKTRSRTVAGVVQRQPQGQGGPVEGQHGHELRSVAPSSTLSITSGIDVDAAAPKRPGLARVPETRKSKRCKIRDGNAATSAQESSSHVIGGISRYRCPVDSCPSTHSWHGNVIRHVKKYHPELEYKFLACRNCHQLFSTRIELVTHKHICNGPTPR